MPFNSFEYLIFFLLVFCGYWLIAGYVRFRVLFLLVASYYFYASHNGWVVVLIFISTLIDYFIAKYIFKQKKQTHKKILVSCSVIINLGILGVFKYYNFFIENFQELGASESWSTMDIMLPVGISFYTFQSMSYMIDVYRGKILPEESITRFALYISFFPQLIAGPIVRAGTFLKQISPSPFISNTNRLIQEASTWGYFRIVFR